MKNQTRNILLFLAIFVLILLLVTIIALVMFLRSRSEFSLRQRNLFASPLQTREELPSRDANYFKRNSTFNRSCMYNNNYLDQTALYLDISYYELQDQLSGGKHIKDLIAEKGKNPDELKSIILADLKSRLVKQIKLGKITQEQSDSISKKEAASIDKFLNR